MSTTVKITNSPLPVLGPLDSALRSGQLYEEIGRDTVKLIRDNFYSLPSNERGFPTTHFWQRAAEATRYEASKDEVRISVNQVGVRQRLLGGDIDPVRAKFLTIPAIAETYGHRAADFSNLKIARGPFQMYTGRLVSLALVPADWKPDESSPYSSKGVYFWLVRHVSQDPNLDVLPPDDEILDTALSAVDRFLANKSRRN
jgi:hypothetical protein